MSVHPILFLGGSGAIGHRSAEALRAAYPDVPLLIGGRDQAKAQQAAEEMGGAQGVVIDPAADDLGLGDRPVSGVAVFSIWIIPWPDCVSRSNARCRT
jgi:nucleoside-diphosphate-sugar epimerase